MSDDATLQRSVTRFVVLSFGRSGSTLLANYISSHPRATCYHEPFRHEGLHPRLAGCASIAEAVDVVFRRGLAPTLGMRARAVARRVLGRRGTWGALGERLHHGRLAAVGFKATVAQVFGAHPDLWRWMVSDRALRIVYLRRGGTLSRHVSYQAAARRGLWHSSDLADVTPFRVRVEPSAFESFVEMQEGEDATIREELAPRWDSVHEVVYEDLAARPAEVMSGVFDALGLPPAPELRGGTIKLVQGEMSQIVENHAELIERYRGTPLEAHVR